MDNKYEQGRFALGVGSDAGTTAEARFDNLEIIQQ